MAKEYKLSFTAAELESTLNKVGTLPTKDYVDGKIPTKLSELENDSKFTTEEAIEELLEGVAAAAHASTHAKDGEDPLTPADIGAEVAGSAASALKDAKDYVDGKIDGKTYYSAWSKKIDPIDSSVLHIFCSLDSNTTIRYGELFQMLL
jgi:hypothetical protein